MNDSGSGTFGKVLVTIFAIMFCCLIGWYFLMVLATDFAREAMSQVFPWVSEPWLQWELNDQTDAVGGVKIVTDDGVTMVAVGTIAYEGIEVDADFVCEPLIDIDYFCDEDPDRCYDGYMVTDGFGTYRTPTYDHSGIDYGTYYMTGLPVYTPMRGQVTFMGPYDGWGWSVIIENDGWQVLLSHASEFPSDIQVGDVVEAGQVVMYSGGGTDNSEKDGNSTGPHLHFEVRECTGEPGSETCYAHDPAGVWLPGQTEDCDWYAQITEND